MEIQTAIAHTLTAIGVAPTRYTQGDLAVTSPVDGRVVAQVHTTPVAEVDTIIDQASKAFQAWRQIPAPRRGELIRLLGHHLRLQKDNLGRLVSLESGKLLQEGLGEVQEMIDICDFAVGLSRQLYGLTIASERPEHKMQENWHPLGPVMVISAFNFPVAVWSWNTTLAMTSHSQDRLNHCLSAAVNDQGSCRGTEPCWRITSPATGGLPPGSR